MLRASRLARTAVAALALALASPALAQVPEPVWSAMKGRAVIVDLADGSTLAGELASIEAEQVVVIRQDGAPVVIGKASVRAIAEARPAPQPLVPPVAPAPPPAAPQQMEPLRGWGAQAPPGMRESWAPEPPPDPPSIKPARRYAGTSASLLNGGQLVGIPQFGGVVAADAGVVGHFGLGATFRLVLNGIAAALEFGGVVVANDRDASGAIVPGFGFGYAIDVSDHVAITPMVKGTIYIYPEQLTLTQVGLELPFAIFVGDSGFLEPYGMMGIVMVEGESAFAGGAGYRLGIMF